MANIQTISLTSIDLKNSPLVRFRKPEQETIEQYAENYRTKVRMPPIVVFYDPDEKRYLLADGRHRCEAIRLLGSEEVSAEVYEGDYAACLKFALTANAGHGVPRSSADKRQCVRAALLQWGAGVTDMHIASLTMVSDKTVASVREEMTQSKQLKPSRVRTKRDGTTYTVAADEPKADMVDAFSKAIPHKVQKYWSRTEEMEVMLNDLEHVHGTLKQAQKEKDVMYAELNYADILSSLSHLIGTVKTAMPYCVCTNCQGHPETQKEGCRLCLGRGLIGKFRYDNLVPMELKAIMKKSIEKARVK